MSSKSCLYTAGEVARILAEQFGDECACDINGNDEWLPFYCEVLNECPNPDRFGCWIQFLKYYDERIVRHDKKSREEGCEYDRN